MNNTYTYNDILLSYFNISWLSETDGPGKRMVLFLQGCLLDCEWCHSPHSKPKVSPILYFDTLCSKCEFCNTACEKGVHSFSNNKHTLLRDKCNLCGACVKACPQSSFYKQRGALVLPTQARDAYSLFDIIRPNLELLKDVGGITFSGGEPLLQSEALALLAKLCKDSGFSTAVETSGIIPVQNIEHVYQYTDTWLIGMRLTTGSKSTVSNYLEKKTRETLKYLTQNPEKEIIVRIPVIPGYTTTEPYLNSTQKILQDFKIKKIELLRHNPESSHYYKALNLESTIEYNPMEASKAFKYVSDFLSYTIT